MSTSSVASLPENSEKNLHFPTVVISDVHLGKDVAKAEALLEFLEHVTCDKLIINGDLIDGWRLEAEHKKLPEMQMRVLDRLNQMAARGAEVIYIAGNHDENLRAHWNREKRKIKDTKKSREPSFLGRDVKMFDPVTGQYFTVKLCDTYDYIDPKERKIRFMHGDQLEPRFLKTKLGRALSKKGDGFYDSFINYDEARSDKKKMKKVKEKLDEEGKPFSLATFAKKSAKSAFRINKAFRKAASRMSKKGYDGVGVGHNHDAYIRDDEDGLYLNSGDWVENCTALAQDEAGNWDLVHWLDKRKELGLEAFPTEDDPNKSECYRPLTEKQLRGFQRLWPGKGIKKKLKKLSQERKKYREMRAALAQQAEVVSELEGGVHLY